jgi:hypothetical protein
LHIFLDFDGVLHDINAGDISYENGQMQIDGESLFQYAPLLAERLSDYSDVKVIIASSWKSHFSLDELRALLGLLGPYVIGTTLSASEFSPCAHRYDECSAMAAYWKADDWRLVDDQPEIVFGAMPAQPEQLQRVIFCNPTLGLATPSVLEQLEKWLGSSISPA